MAPDFNDLMFPASNIISMTTKTGTEGDASYLLDDNTGCINTHSTEN